MLLKKNVFVYNKEKEMREFFPNSRPSILGCKMKQGSTRVLDFFFNSVSSLEFPYFVSTEILVLFYVVEAFRP